MSDHRPSSDEGSPEQRAYRVCVTPPHVHSTPPGQFGVAFRSPACATHPHLPAVRYGGGDPSAYTRGDSELTLPGGEQVVYCVFLSVVVVCVVVDFELPPPGLSSDGDSELLSVVVEEFLSVEVLAGEEAGAEAGGGVCELAGGLTGAAC